jgi:hypothetical protein
MRSNSQCERFLQEHWFTPLTKIPREVVSVRDYMSNVWLEVKGRMVSGEEVSFYPPQDVVVTLDGAVYTMPETRCGGMPDASKQRVPSLIGVGSADHARSSGISREETEGEP